MESHNMGIARRSGDNGSQYDTHARRYQSKIAVETAICSCTKSSSCLCIEE